MRTATWLAVGATAVVLAAGAAPGRPNREKPEKADKPVKVTSLKDAAGAFAKVVAAELGKDAEVKYTTNAAPSVCRAGYEPANQVFEELSGKVKIEWRAEKPTLAADEQVALVIVDAKKGRTFRFAVALEERIDPNNPAGSWHVLRCTSAALAVTYEVIDQKVIGEFLHVPLTNDRKAGGLVIAPAPVEADPKLNTRIDVREFGTIKIHKREGKDGIDPRPLPFEVRKLDLTPTVSGWRYRCKELTAETTFEVVLYNEQSHAWAIEVELDGRSSTAEAADRFAGAKYILPAKEADMDAKPCFIKGWLKGPKGKPGANGVQSFEYTEFLVKNVPDKDPALARVTAEARSTIRIAWYAAWPTGTKRPKELPNPQSGGTDIVGKGKHGAQNMQVVEYDTDKLPLGSVVIEFGGLAMKD